MTAMLSAGARVTRITWRLTAAGWNQFNDVTDWAASDLHIAAGPVAREGNRW